MQGIFILDIISVGELLGLNVPDVSDEPQVYIVKEDWTAMDEQHLGHFCQFLMMLAQFFFPPKRQVKKYDIKNKNK